MINLKPQIKIAENAINHGIKILIIFAALFLVWAIFLPIKSASIAEGIIVLDFNRKIIQHLEGGIIDQILVKEGQVVNEGDVLLYLHNIKAKTEQQILKERLWTMQLQKHRLTSAKENKQTLNLNNFFFEMEELSPADKEKLQEISTNQLQLFKAKKDKKSGEVKVLEKKIKICRNKIKTFSKRAKPNQTAS